MSRLEEIIGVVNSQSHSIRKLSHNDLNWLIAQTQKAEELQAKVDELEGEIEGLLQTLEDKEPYYSNLCLILEKQNQRYKQALEEVKSLTINPREYQPSTYTIHQIVSDALKGVEG